MAQPVTPSMWPSTHQPSSTDRLGTPLNAAFMPLVPEASSGGSGVFSHHIHARHQQLRQRHVVVGQEHRGDGRAQRTHVLVQQRDQPLALLVARVRLAGQHDLERVALRDALRGVPGPSNSRSGRL